MLSADQRTVIPYHKLLFQNGTLLEIAMGRAQWHVPTSYCVDMRVSDETPRMVAAVCFPLEDSTDDSQALYIAYSVGKKTRY